VERALETSDNEATEVLARHVGLAAGDEGSTVAGVRAITRTLAGLGVPTEGLVLRDGSGLSRQGRIPAATLLGTLAVAAADDRPDLRPVLTGLPVAGATGSLAVRFGDGDPAGPGLVRAKTGTLTGVHGLAGLVTTADGAVLPFVLAADRVPLGRDLDARVALDRAAAALAGCRCGGA
jgi:D-alanyl-D-alanine carboxypeptidase/D-alanyl-D-alanine-endopeptidase (penicillin-binding protein 4)